MLLSFLSVWLIAAKAICSQSYKLESINEDTGTRKVISETDMLMQAAFKRKGGIARITANADRRLRRLFRNFLQETNGRRHFLQMSLEIYARQSRAKLNQAVRFARASPAVMSMQVNVANQMGSIGFYALQVLGFVQSLEAMTARGPDGKLMFEFVSVTGILTIAAFPGQAFAAVTEPIMIIDPIRQLIRSMVKYPFHMKQLVMAILHFNSVEVARLSALTGNAKIGISSRTLGSTLGKSSLLARASVAVSTVAVTIMAPLAIIDIALSASQLHDTISAKNLNTDPVFNEYHSYAVGMAAGGVVLSVVSGVLTGLLMFAGAVSATGVGAALGLLVCGIAGLIMFFTDNSIELMLKAQRAARLRQYQELEESNCNLTLQRFFHYLIKFGQDMVYLTAMLPDVQNSSTFDLRQSHGSEPYVHLSKIVVEENSVIPTASRTFSRQFQRQYQPIQTVSSMNRSVSIDTVVLPSNLFLSVGSHRCEASPADNGVCHVASVHRVLITKVKMTFNGPVWADHTGEYTLDARCDILVRGRFVANLPMKVDTNAPSWWNLDIILNLARFEDKFEAFDMHCFDEDMAGNNADDLGIVQVELYPNSTSRSIRSSFDEIFQTQARKKGHVDIEFAYEVAGQKRSHEEWLLVESVSLVGNCEGIRGGHHDLSFTGCELVCDRQADCNARAYNLFSRECSLYSCRDVSSLTSFEIHQEAETEPEVAYIRIKTINCGGHRARSCEECTTCAGDCRLNEYGRCAKRICGACVFPFIKDEKQYWGCTGNECATELDMSGKAVKTERCDMNNSQCMQLCATHNCTYGSSPSPYLACVGDCTDAQCGCPLRRSRRDLENDNLSKLYGVPENTNQTILNLWKDAALAVLHSDVSCVGTDYGNGDVTHSRVIFPVPGHSPRRQLEVVINKDALIMQTVNTLKLPDAQAGFYESTPLHIQYDIRMNGGSNETGTRIDGVSLKPLYYTLTLPGFEFGPDTPVDRSSSFSYKLHKTNVRDTFITLDFPSYARNRRDGFSWEGIHQNCIEPFAKNLRLVQPRWEMPLLVSSPRRFVRRFRAIEMGDVVNDRISFFVRRGTYQCQVNHITKTFALEAIVAHDPKESSMPWNRRYYHYVDRTSKNWQINVDRTDHLAHILKTLEDYRSEYEIEGFKREERLVPVILGNSTEVTFYFNAIAGWRPWTVFVPRIRQTDVHIDALEGSLFPAQQIHSYNLLSGMVNVTYIFPILGSFYVPKSVGLVTLLLPHAENPKVVRITCPTCEQAFLIRELEASIHPNTTLDLSEFRIVNTHTWYRVRRAVSLTRYYSNRMNKNEYFPHDDTMFVVGYVASSDGNGCVLARTMGDLVDLYRGYPVTIGDRPNNLTKIHFPVRGINVTKFTVLLMSKTPGCSGIEAVSADDTRYCVTCTVVTILELRNQISIPSEPIWEYLLPPNVESAEETSDPGAASGASTPSLTLFTQEKAGDFGHGILQYREWTFCTPKEFIGAVTPWSVDSQHRLYAFMGIVRVDPVGGGDVFAIWMPRNVEADDIILCMHARNGTGNCTNATSDWGSIRDADEMRFHENGVGTWVIRPSKNKLPYEFVVDRVIDDALESKSSQFRTVLFQRGNSSTYGYRGCEFVLHGNVSLVSRGSVEYDAKGFLAVENIVHMLSKTCHVASLNIRLGEFMTSHAWLETLHLELNAFTEIPRIPGYSVITIDVVGSRNITVKMSPAWSHGMDEVNIGFVVTQSVTAFLVRLAHDCTTPTLTAQPLAGNENVTIEVLIIPDEVDDDSREATNTENIELLARYQAYQLTSTPRYLKHTCSDICDLQSICLPSRECVDPIDIFSRLMPAWRKKRGILPADMYCFEQLRSYFLSRRCANLRDFYTYTARRLLQADLARLDASELWESTFGNVMVCNNATCATNAAVDILSGQNVTFVLQLVNASANKAHLALWPDFERSARGFAGGSRMEISSIEGEEKCERMRSVPMYAKELTKSDPDGFGRLVEQIFYEVRLNQHCVRVSSAYAAMPSKEYQTVADSIPSLMSNSGSHPFVSDRHIYYNHYARRGSYLVSEEGPKIFRLKRTLQTYRRGQSILSRNFRAGGETAVDMRISSVFTVIESLLTFINVAKEQEWNLSAIRKRDLLWSLFKDGDFLYFERFGGITLCNWPTNIFVGPNMGNWYANVDDVEGPVLGPLLKRMLDVMPHIDANLTIGSSALAELHKWRKVIELDFLHERTMARSIQFMKKLKSDFPNIEKCVTPTDPGYSASRYMFNTYGRHELISVRRTTRGRFRLGFYAQGPRIDDSCDEYALTFHVCANDSTVSVFRLRYNGIHWDPIVEGPTPAPFHCSPLIPTLSSVVPMVPKWSALVFPLGHSSRGSTHPMVLRVRVRDAQKLCAMNSTQYRHIRAVQHYTAFRGNGYVGSEDPRYRLRVLTNGAFQLCYHGRHENVLTLLVLETADIPSLTPFVLEDPLRVEQLKADVPFELGCVEDELMPPTISRYAPQRVTEATPMPDECTYVLDEKMCAWLSIRRQQHFYFDQHCMARGNFVCDDFSDLYTRHQTCLGTPLLEWIAARGECRVECAKNRQCKYVTQYGSGWCQLWSTCAQLRDIDAEASIFFKKSNSGTTYNDVFFFGASKSLSTEHSSHLSSLQECIDKCQGSRDCQQCTWMENMQICNLHHDLVQLGAFPGAMFWQKPTDQETVGPPPPDEPTWVCRENEFRCLDGSECVAPWLICDATPDCRDGSDEVSCETCVPYERPFRCATVSGKAHCISASWVCDGERDCSDGRDEEDASCVFSTLQGTITRFSSFPISDIQKYGRDMQGADNELQCALYCQEAPECKFFLFTSNEQGQPGTCTNIVLAAMPRPSERIYSVQQFNRGSKFFTVSRKLSGNIEEKYRKEFLGYFLSADDCKYQCQGDNCDSFAISTTTKYQFMKYCWSLASWNDVDKPARLLGPLRSEGYEFYEVDKEHFETFAYVP